MNQSNVSGDGIKSTDDIPSSGSRTSKSFRSFVIRILFAGLLGTGALFLPVTGHTLSLDEAVKAQLDHYVATDLVCSQLRNGNPANPTYLTDELYIICIRGGPIGGAGPSTASLGGGAGTPTTLPRIVQQRLREKPDKGKNPKIKVSAASADYTFEGAKRLGFFVAAEGEVLDRNVTTFEDGYESNILRLIAGADAKVAERIIAGLALDISRHDGNFDEGGDFVTDSYGLVGFGSFLPTDKSFVQFYGGYTRNSYDRNRFASFIETNSDETLNFTTIPFGTIATTDYNANQYSAGILGGYDLANRNVTISLSAGIDWKYTDFDTHSETGTIGIELTFYDDEQSSLQSNVGVQASMELKAGSWTIVPQARAVWKYEFKNDQRDVEVSFVDDTRAQRFTYQTEDPDRNWGEINAGVAAALPSGVQMFANYRTMVGHSFFESHAGTIGLRVPF